MERGTPRSAFRVLGTRSKSWNAEREQERDKAVERRGPISVQNMNFIILFFASSIDLNKILFSFITLVEGIRCDHTHLKLVERLKICVIFCPFFDVSFGPFSTSFLANFSTSFLAHFSKKTKIKKLKKKFEKKIFSKKKFEKKFRKKKFQKFFFDHQKFHQK